MRTSTAALLGLTLSSSALGGHPHAVAASAGTHWPQWRGPSGSGVSLSASPPTRWGNGENLRWKASIAGKGHSTPIIWGDHIVITSAVPHGEALQARSEDRHGDHDNMHALRAHDVVALDRHTGAHRWQSVVHDEQPHESAHRSARSEYTPRHLLGFSGPRR